MPAMMGSHAASLWMLSGPVLLLCGMAIVTAKLYIRPAKPARAPNRLAAVQEQYALGRMSRDELDRSVQALLESSHEFQELTANSPHPAPWDPQERRES